MKRTVRVTTLVEVEVDESKFDDAFMADFRRQMYPFHSIDNHIEHLAQLEARGLLGDFIEGYGPTVALGIKASVAHINTKIVE